MEITNYLNIIPENTKNILEDYQKEGITQMILRLESKVNGCILADEMGLGKTLQTICVIIYYLNKDPKLKFLIIAPKTIIPVWKAQLTKYAPNLFYYIFKGNREELNMTKANIILTTYPRVVSEFKHEKNVNDDKKTEFLQNQCFFMIILDEGHKIKNELTAVSKSVKNLKGNKKIIITGTPMENHFNDFISLVDFIHKDYLHRFKIIFKKYSEKEKYKIAEDKNQTMVKNSIEEIRKIIQIFVVRRNQSDVLPLPLLNISEIKSTLTSIQKKFLAIWGYGKKDYNQSYLELLKASRLEIWKNFWKFYLTLHDEELKRHVMEELKDIAPIKMANKVLLLFQHPVIMFPETSDFNDSNKTIALLEKMKEIPKHEKIIVFASSPILLDMLAKELKKNHINAYLITGRENSLEKRAHIVKMFQTNEIQKDEKGNIMENDPLYYQVALISIRVGSCGIDLTRANNVFFLCVPWTYTETYQAICRVYRRGQIRPVNVYMMLLEDTCEIDIYNRSLNLYNLFTSLFNKLDFFPNDIETINSYFDQQIIANKAYTEKMELDFKREILKYVNYKKKHISKKNYDNILNSVKESEMHQFYEFKKLRNRL